jgi:hypothetical protein
MNTMNVYGKSGSIFEGHLPGFQTTNRRYPVSFPKFILILLLLIAFAPFLVLAEEWGNYHISYIREVGNQLYLSDFQLGSEETIKDEDGHGISIGRFFNNNGVSFFLISLGTSQTIYRGTVEDGVNVGFTPSIGSGYEVLSSSKNIFYDVKLEFTNNYISFNYTNWNILRYSLRSHYLLPSTYGIGLIFQTAKGNVDIKGIDDTLIARASYQSGVQRFFYLGWSVNYEFLYLSLLARYVTSPVLEIDYCNLEAVGQAACDRIEAATGNRNNSTTLFTGGVFELGILF